MMWKLYVIRFQVSINQPSETLPPCLTYELVVAALLWKHNSEAVMETGLQILKYVRSDLLQELKAWRLSTVVEGSGIWYKTCLENEMSTWRGSGSSSSEIWQCSCCSFGVWTVVRVPKMMVRSGSRGPAAQMPESLLMTGPGPLGPSVRMGRSTEWKAVLVNLLGLHKRGVCVCMYVCMFSTYTNTVNSCVQIDSSNSIQLTRYTLMVCMLRNLYVAHCLLFTSWWCGYFSIL